MMNNDEQRPIRAGRAYQEVLQGDRAAQDAWTRVELQLRAFGELMRSTLEPPAAVRAAVTEHAADVLQPYCDLGEALGTALSGDFERLRALVDAYPALRQAADELERAVQELHRGDSAEADVLSQRLQDALAGSRERLEAHTPNLDDPAFWSGIVPIGEQIRDALRAVMQKQTGTDHGKISVVDVTAQLERYRAAGGPYLDQRTFSRLCGCQPSTINKAIQKKPSLRAWKDAAVRARKQGAAPRRDTGDFDIVMEQVAAKSEQPVMADEVDAIMNKLRRQAVGNPEWIRTLEEMSSDERARIAQLYADGDYEPSALEQDMPSERPRQVKRHGRV